MAFSLSSLYAQTFVTLQGIASFQNSNFGSSNADPDPSSWTNGIGFAAQVSAPITKSLFLSPAIEFDQFRFDHYIYYGVRIPESSPTSSRGEDSRIFRIGLEAKLVSITHPNFSPYVSSGITYITEHLGDIYVTYSDAYDSKPREFKLQNHSKSYWAHSLGVGTKFILFDNFGFDFAAKYYSNYSDRFQKSVSVGLIYQFD